MNSDQGSAVPVQIENHFLQLNKIEQDLLFNQSPIAIEIFDYEGKLVSINPAGINLFGLIDPEEVKGFNFFEDPNIPDKFKKDIKQRKTVKFEQEFDFQNVKDLKLYNTTKSGKLCLDVIINPIFSEPGLLEGYLLHCQDITSQKRSAKYSEMGSEILNVLNQPSSVMESIKSVLAILKERTGFDAIGIRLKNGEDFPYFVQEGFPEKFLMTENSILERDRLGEICRDENGKPSLECTCGLVISGKTDPANPLFTVFGSCWMNNSLLFLDVPIEKDPRFNPRNLCFHLKFASIALIPIRVKSEIMGLIQFNDKRKNCFTLSDIEQFEGISGHIGAALMRKAAEEEINSKNEQIITLNKQEIKKKNDQLRELIAAKDKLFSIIAHDLKNPFQIFLSTAQIISEEASELSKKEIEHLGKMLYQSSKNLYALLKNLLDWSQMQQGTKRYEPEILSVNELISESINLITAMAKAKNICINNNVFEDLNAFGDKNMTSSVIINLLSNAVKFTNLNGSITIDAKRKDSESIVISISDTGIGMEESIQNKLFKIGEGVGRSGTEGEQSTGIGLLLCKEFIEKSNGQIWVESKPSIGSTFYFTLPSQKN